MSNIKAGAVQAPLLSDSPKPSKTPHADIGDYEARVTRKAIWWTVVPVLGLTLALSVLLAMENRNPAPPSPSVSDLSVELATIHRAATAAGISQFRSADPGEVGAWLASQQVAVGRVPDLSSSGLTASGARLLSMPGGRWGMVHYKAEDRLASDLVLAIAPAGAAIVPPRGGGGGIRRPVGAVGPGEGGGPCLRDPVG